MWFRIKCFLDEGLNSVTWDYLPRGYTHLASHLEALFHRYSIIKRDITPRPDDKPVQSLMNWKYSVLANKIYFCHQHLHYVSVKKKAFHFQGYSLIG